eukprot:TRINITY_DN1920_c2_g1_i3.p1 TRINITY_DN1920_c2_g1~~TRINITY_DN1920_c2_g1_i3.p1  ORF type:complete len:427 (+),score=18.15 TRINITY_DN1920_c2_g1_i3:119-1399(+)
MTITLYFIVIFIDFLQVLVASNYTSQYTKNIYQFLDKQSGNTVKNFLKKGKYIQDDYSLDQDQNFESPRHEDYEQQIISQNKIQHQQQKQQQQLYLQQPNKTSIVENQELLTRYQKIINNYENTTQAEEKNIVNLGTYFQHKQINKPKQNNEQYNKNYQQLVIQQDCEDGDISNYNSQSIIQDDDNNSQTYSEHTQFEQSNLEQNISQNKLYIHTNSLCEEAVETQINAYNNSNNDNHDSNNSTYQVIQQHCNYDNVHNNNIELQTIQQDDNIRQFKSTQFESQQQQDTYNKNIQRVTNASCKKAVEIQNNEFNNSYKNNNNYKNYNINNRSSTFQVISQRCYYDNIDNNNNIELQIIQQDDNIRQFKRIQFESEQQQQQQQDMNNYNFQRLSNSSCQKAIKTQINEYYNNNNNYNRHIIEHVALG